MTAKGSTRDAERDALVASHLTYARKLAVQLSRELPRAFALDDLIAVAQAGLVDAATRFDPSRGAQFSTFAYYRIRGAVLDHVRDAASSNPHVRARAAAAAAVDDLVEQRLGDPAVTPYAAAQQAAQALSDMLCEMATAYTLADLGEQTAPSVPLDPETASVASEMRAHLESNLAVLPERERAMLQKVYFEGLTIEQAGRVFGLSKSWSSRLHARAVGLLRTRLAGVSDGL